VLDGDPAHPKREQPTNSRPMSIVAKQQTAAWIKLPLCMDVGLGPGDIVLNGDLAPP